jgi:hypothetical protein
MTAPATTLPDDTALFGPGTFTVGATGSELEIACYINSLTLSANSTVGDSVTKLCGAVRAGAVDIQYQLDGNVDIDIARADGLLALSWDSAGSTQPFTFVPNDDAITSIAGELVITPLSIGGDTYGETMVSDFTWTCQGKPVITFGPVIP